MSEPKFKIGTPVTYQEMDGEEGRSYGWFLATKKATIVSIYYKLDNGDIVEEKKLTLLQSESKSDEKKPE